MKLIRKTDIWGNDITEVVPDVPICDFCCHPTRPVRWAFTVADGTVSYSGPPDPGEANVVLSQGKVLFATEKALRMHSTGGKWAACDRCKALVEARQATKLAAISAHQYIENNRQLLNHIRPTPPLFKRIAQAQRAFWSNWDGQPAAPWYGEPPILLN